MSPSTRRAAAAGFAALLGLLPALVFSQDLAMSVFEVVIPKPEGDTLVYREPLPIDRLPFRERTDPYLSVGTAFAIPGGRFVTAAHVLTPDRATFNSAGGLRDQSGKVYAIGRALAYSNNRDYVVFDVPGLNAVPLELATDYKLNTPVRTVGNAYGEGIVIRDGTLTSATLEDRDGAWRWLRFTAAASPGNSGGPLLDASGKVAGVVVMKSENENLNYALPAAELDLRPVARYDRQVRYVIPNLTEDLLTHDQFELSLPLPWDDFRREMTRRAEELEIAAGERLAALNPRARFPSPAASSLLDVTWYEPLPQLISQRTDGGWYRQDPEKPASGRIDPGGKLDYGEIGSYTFFRLALPEGLSLAAALDDERTLMDAIVKGYGLSRTMAGKPIAITSLGPSLDRGWITDRWGRRWLAASWAVRFADMRELVWVLPVPGGAVGIMTRCSEGSSTAIKFDTRFMLDFVHATHVGTLAQWRDFLALGDKLPEDFRGWSIEGGPGKPVVLRTDRFSLRIDPAVLPWKDTGLVYALSSFMPGPSGVQWGVSRLYCTGASGSGSYVDLARWASPGSGADAEAKSDWEKCLAEEWPYDGTARTDKQQKYARGVVFPTPDGSVATQPPFVYTLLYTAASSLSDKTMSERLKTLRAAVALDPRELVFPPGGEASRIMPLVWDSIDGKNLFDAVAGGDAALLNALLAKKTRLDIRNTDGRTPLAQAVRTGHEALALRLAAAGSPLTGTDRSGATVLHLGAVAGSADLAAALLPGSPEREARDATGRTPLLVAAESGNLPWVRALMAAGADAGAADRRGRGAAALALAGGHNELAAELIAAGSSTATRDEDGWTPLMLALKGAPDALVERILTLAPADARTTNLGWTAFHVAARYGRSAFLPRLAAGVPVEAATAQGRTALMLAAESGDEATVRWLLGRGASKAAVDRDGETAASIARRADFSDLAKLLEP